MVVVVVMVVDSFFFSLFPASSTAGTYPYKVQISLQSRSTAPAVL